MDVIADRYELGRTLGAGGMARVVEAYDRVLDRQVAVKLLRDDIAVDPSVRNRFLGEARTAARFNHPNAVTVFDTGQDGRVPWIVMELIEGEDLAQRLARTGPLDEDQAVAIGDAVLAALDAAHQQGFVHRDVKPGNIMLLDDGRVKLADFGIAKGLQEATAGLTATGQIIGTAKYLSPEQVDGRAASPASDVYAMGCVMFEMLAGDPPFVGESPIAIALAHTRDAVPDLRARRPDVSPAVATAVSRALAKDPADRFGSAGDMRAALRGERVGAAYDPTAVLAESATTHVLPPARDRGRRTPWALIALVVLGLLGALFLLSALNNDDTDSPTRAERRAERRQERQEQQQDAAPTPEPTLEPTQQPTAEPTSEPTEQAPDEEPIVPTDIPSLISLLSSQPGTYGSKQDNLVDGLQEVEETSGDEQAENAAKLQSKITDWVDKGDLNPEIGNLAFGLLEPLAAPFYGGEEEGGGEDEGGPPPGKGKDKGKGKNKDE